MARVVKGKYEAIARDWKLGETDNTHTPFIGVRFELLGPEVDGIEMNFTGWLNDDKAGKDGLTSFDRTLRSMRACGWSGADLSNLAGMGTRRVSVTIDDEISKKDGKTYSKIIFVNELGGGALVVKTPIAGAKMRELIAMSKAKAKALAVLPADEGAPVAKAADGDADVPF